MNLKLPARLLSALLLALPGCTMIPSLPATDASVAGQFPGSDGGAGGVSVADIGWRDFIRDPRLRRLTDIALTNNRDLRVAMLNVEASRAQYRVQRAADFPTVDAGGSFSRQKNGDRISNQFSATGSVSYELDVFGRIRSLNAQALENFLATAEAQRGVRLSLIAELATQYFNWCQIQEQIELANQTLKTINASRELTKSKVEAGGANELDLRSADAQVQSAKVSVISYERQAALAVNALTLLLGQPMPADLPPRKPLGNSAILTNIRAGLPSDLLLLRPDILEAEHTLRAANANIGAARAAFFPSISLTGSTGTSSVEVQDLFAKGTGSWGFNPRISVPIFSGGANRANLDAAQIRTRTEAARYEKSIQTAFREVADALAANASYRRQLEAQALLIEAQQKRYDLADARYREGLDDYLNVLSAQQDLYGSQQSLLQIRADILTNMTALYKALGGGWK